MPPEIVPHPARERTSVEQTLIDAVREHENYGSVAVIGYDADGNVFHTSSNDLTTEQFVCLLLDVQDSLRGR